MLRACCLLPLLIAAAGLAAQEQTDLILHNGKIVTVDSGFSIQEAVAARGGRIVAVGSSSRVLTLRGPGTRVIDLRGKTVLPGLIDSHVHALSAATSEAAGSVPAGDSIQSLQNDLRQRARRTPKGEWIVVSLPFPTRLREMRMPTRADLDVIADHPVLLDHSMIVVVNSLGLKFSGITRATPNPPGGIIVKDANGEPNGVLRNARSLLRGRLPARAQYAGDALTLDRKVRALEGMLERYIAAGLTSIKDREATREEEIAVFQELRKRNGLKLRVSITWALDGSRPTAELIETIRNGYRPGAGDEWLKFGTFKVILDGGMLLGTAYQRQPYGPFGKQLYAMTDPDNRGQLFVAPQKLAAVMRAAFQQGWQLTAHTQGGGAIDTLLDCFETLTAEGPLARTRSHVMHASFQSPEAIRKLKRLGVWADAQAAWLYCDSEALEQVFGTEGMRYFFPLRTYLDAGVPVAGGSDHFSGLDKNRATNPYNPFLGMWVSVTRKNDRGRAVHPEERVTREEALKMYTIRGAEMEFAEKVKGSIEVGKFADMVVIDRDYLTCPEDEIRSIEPVMTIIDGRVAYAAAQSSRSGR